MDERDAAPTRAEALSCFGTLSRGDVKQRLRASIARNARLQPRRGGTSMYRSRDEEFDAFRQERTGEVRAAACLLPAGLDHAALRVAERVEAVQLRDQRLAGVQEFFSEATRRRLRSSKRWRSTPKALPPHRCKRK